MAIRTYKVTLDTKNAIAPEPVCLRQGDKTGAVVIDATLMDNGSPVSLSGLTPSFMANTADGKAVVSDTTGFAIVDASGGEFTYQVPSQLGSVAGKIQIAYFSFVDSEGNQSTFDVAFIVKKAADMTQESAKDWVSTLSEIIEQYNQWTNDAHNSWERFVNDNKEIIESIDPGGKVISELIGFRHSDMLSKTFDTAKLRGDFFDNDLRDRGLNVKWFGAVGDGVADDTKAIKDAISAAKSGTTKCIYFPSGTYLTTLTNQIISGISIRGENRMTSTIISDTADPVFLVGTNSTIKSLGFHSTVATDNSMIGIGKSSTGDVAEWNITLEDLRFDSIEYPDPTHAKVGGWGLRPINFVLDNLGLWDVTVRNVSMQYVYSGLNIDTINGGWLTGSLFDNIVVKGFDHHAFGIISSNQTLNQVSQCVFSNLTAQVLYETHGDDASGYIIAGGGNEFDNLRLFNDGTYNNHAITLRFFGSSPAFKEQPSFAKGTTTSNTFSGGEIEGYVYDPDNLKRFQKFVNLKTRVAPVMGDMQDVTVADETFENLLSKSGTDRNFIGDLQKSIPPSASVSSGTDAFGHYLDIAMGADAGSFDYHLTEPESTLNAIKNGAFSIGIRFVDVSGSSNMSSYLRFNDKDLTTKQSLFVNKNKHSNISEWVWKCEKMTDKFNTITSFSGKNAVIFYLVPNSHVRIYNVMLVAGITVDFDNVVERSDVNGSNSATTPRWPQGVSLNEVTTNLIKYSGTYFADSISRPADAPKEFSDHQFIISVVPGSNSNNGYLKLFDIVFNTILQAGVNNGAASGWIKLHA